MVESPQRIYVHDSTVIQDDGETLHDVSLNTRDETPSGEREALYEAVYNAGVDPALLHDEIDADIGQVWFNEDDTISHVELEEWVLEEYGN